MKNLRSTLLLCTALCTLFACGKQETPAERQAEIDRQVQQRLDAEHQAQAQQDLNQREADLNARAAALEARASETPATSAPATEAARTAQPNESANDSYATFYRRLDSYGDWMETSNYGFVFQPRAARTQNWRPYTEGHWVYTDAGWTWISDEPFGWATYHYGRWIRLRSVGWVWVPGDQWAPAWVSWRKGTDYVGWAPLPPDAHFDRQTGIRNWADSYYDIGPEQYAFVPANEFGGSQSARVVVPRERNITIINQTTNVTNITYNNSTVVDRGPSYDDLRARSRYQIQKLRLERNRNTNDERPVIRGEVVALPAPEIRPAQANTRPPRVQRTIQNPTVERGWEGIRDRSQMQKAREKMEQEATPPPNLPAKKFVRPNPTAPAATVTPTAKAQATATPEPRRRPVVRPTATLTATPTATPTPTPGASASATPAATAAPQPELNQRQQRQAQRAEKRREARTRRGAEATVSPSPSASPTASASAAASPSPSPTETATASPRKGPRRPHQP